MGTTFRDLVNVLAHYTDGIIDSLKGNRGQPKLCNINQNALEVSKLSGKF